MKKIIIIAFLLVAGFGTFTHADTPVQNSFYYVFHLYYDAGKLVADRDFKFSYDIIPGDFVANPVGQFPYYGEIVNLVGSIASSFKFDVHVGKLSVNAPYVADGQKVIFYDNQNQPVLTIPVSESSFCNDDGICNADRGEDSLSCPKDCKQTLPAPPTESPTPVAGGSSGIWSSIIYALVGILLAGLGWWFFKRRRSANTLTPPPAPLQSGGQALPPPERLESSSRAGTPPPPTGGSTGNFPSQNNPV